MHWNHPREIKVLKPLERQDVVWIRQFTWSSLGMFTAKRDRECDESGLFIVPVKVDAAQVRSHVISALRQDDSAADTGSQSSESIELFSIQLSGI